MMRCAHCVYLCIILNSFNTVVSFTFYLADFRYKTNFPMELNQVYCKQTNIQSLIEKSQVGQRIKSTYTFYVTTPLRTAIQNCQYHYQYDTVLWLVMMHNYAKFGCQRFGTALYVLRIIPHCECDLDREDRIPNTFA